MEELTTPTGHNSRDPGVPSTLKKKRGSDGGEGGEGLVGVLVGKNQTGPNYRNHNESVSRGTLLPGKHRSICVHSQMHARTHRHGHGHTHTQMQNSTTSINLHKFWILQTGTETCTCAHMSMLV